MKTTAALPKQLQFMLKQVAIPIPLHDKCLHARAMSQMTEYLKIVSMRTSVHPDEGEHAYDLTELLGFVHSLSAEDRHSEDHSGAQAGPG
jgi:hypothetical protein